MSDLDRVCGSATESIARAVMLRTPGWVADRLYNHMWVFGDSSADAPGRHVICDGTTNHPVVIANARGCRITIELPHVVGADDVDMVLETLTAFGALDPSGGAGPVGPVDGKTPGWRSA